MTLPRKFLARWKIAAVLVAIVLTSIIIGRATEAKIWQWYRVNEQIIKERIERVIQNQPEVAGDRDERPGMELWMVTEVVDGDTIKVMMKDREETVRLLGVDAPEMRDKNVSNACFARIAKQRLKEKVDGRQVILETDLTQGDRDRYGRLLRDAYLEEGTSNVPPGTSNAPQWINGWLVQEGLATHYERFPVKNSDILRQYEMEARNQFRGMWSGRCQ